MIFCKIPMIQSLALIAMLFTLDVWGALPTTQCGWPHVANGGLYGPWTVRLAQYLASSALNTNLQNASGIYDATTVKLIEMFQQKENMPIDGVIGAVTWAGLATANSGLRPGAVGAAVRALQDSLTQNGFPVPITGTYDNDITSKALQAFQLAHNGTDTSGVVTQETWQMLVTRCYSGGVFWFDAGWPQGKMDIDYLTCLHDTAGFRFATFECWVEEGVSGSFWSECVNNIANAWKVGMESVGVYMFAQRFADPTVQAQQLLGNLSHYGVQFDSIMLDIEGDKWNNFTTAENQAFLLALRRAIVGSQVWDNSTKKLIVYCGRDWPNFFGESFDDFQDCPLIYAHYDNVPSYYDFYPTYGGWTTPSGKQFWDGANGEVAPCGGGALDWDWSASRFW